MNCHSKRGRDALPLGSWALIIWRIVLIAVLLVLLLASAMTGRCGAVVPAIVVPQSEAVRP